MDTIFKKRSCLGRREIRAYINDQIEESKLLDIENHLLDCQLCSSAIDGLSQETDWIVTSQQLDDIDQYLAEKYQPEEVLSKKSSIWQGRISQVALVALIGLLIYVSFQYWQQNKGDKLSAQFFVQPASEYLTFRGTTDREDKISSTLLTALNHYSGEAYKESIIPFQEYLKQQPNDDDARLLLATALLQSGEAAASEVQLIKLQADRFGAPENLKWYLSLAYLAQGKMMPARRILKELSSNSPTYKYQSKELLDKF